MRKFLFTILAGFVLLATQAFAQERTVTGRVTADDGSVLPGVNVTIKGTTRGTTTNSEGMYSINAANTETLVFSFIGFETQEVVVGNENVHNVTMTSDVNQLQEVVVTALGIQRNRNELAYSAQKVEGEMINRTREANFVNALSGKVAGLEVRRNNSLGGSTNIVLRGVKSLTGNNQALFVVDGVPVDNSVTNTTNQQTGRGGYDYGNAAADINPDDIESISVLKGAAATALYGSRASNGVIMITTKKGRRTKGIGVTVNTGMTVGKIDKSTFINYQNEYGAGYGPFYESEDGYFLSRDINGDGVADLVTPFSEDASYGGRFDPNLMVYQWDAFDPASPNFGQARPWVAAANGPASFFRTAISSSHSVMVNGASEQGFFKLGYTRNADNGILPNSNVTRNLLNFGASYNMAKNLTASASVNFSNVKGLGRYGTGYDTNNLMTNFRQWWQTNVDIKEQEEAYMRNRQNVTWNWSDPSDLVPIYWDNPYWTRYENFQNDNRIRTFGNVALNYKVASWLDIMGRITVDAYDEMQEERTAVGSLNPSEYQRFNRSFREFNYDLFANFDKNLSEDISLKGVVGTNIRRTNVESIRASTNGGLVVPGLYALSNSLNPINAPVETQSALQVNGIFASATLGYQDFLFLDLTARRDESSSLPAGNNVYYYPSASLGFVFSKFVTAPWLTFGKARVNYAEVGNTAPVQSINDVYTAINPFGSTSLFSVNGTKNNPNLQPERTKSYEAGLEMSFLNGRLGFDATYYNMSTVDQIVPVSVSVATGYNSMYINAGTIQNKGVELALFATPVRSDNFTWSMNINWSRNRNKVKELPGIDNLLLASFQGGVTINAALGQPYGTIRGQNFVYNENGQRVVGANGNYLRSTTSNEIIGNANPNWIGGINNNFKYRSVAFSFLIDTRQGGSVFSLDRYYGLATGLSTETVGLNDLGNPSRNAISDGGGIILPGVKEDGTPNDIRVPNDQYGAYGYRRNPAAGFVYDASFVKLREASLTYSLPSNLVSRIGFTGVDLSLIGRNLWIIHKNLPDADPEDNISAGNVQGYQGGSYPTTRNIGFNVRLRF